MQQPKTPPTPTQPKPPAAKPPAPPAKPKGPVADPTKPFEVKLPFVAPEIQLACVRFSPCGTVLAAAGFDGTVRRWDVTGDTPAELPKLDGLNGWVNWIAFHPDAKRLYAVDSWGALACWDYTAKEPAKLWHVPTAHAEWVRKVAASPDGSTVATCGRDGKVKLWPAAGTKPRAELDAADDVFSVAYHPSGALVTGDLHGRVKQWDAAGTVARTLDCPELYHTSRMQDVGGVRCFAFDKDGKTLYAAGCAPTSGGFVQGTPMVIGFDWATGKRGHSWKCDGDKDGFCHDLRSHPNGYLMGATSGQPGTGKVFLWKPGEPQPWFQASKQNCHSLDVHPDGVRLVVSSTNANSSGNGRPKGETYPTNSSPVHLITLPKV